MVNPSKKAGLGNTLIKAQKIDRRKRSVRRSDKHVVDSAPDPEHVRIDLRSVTAQTNLDQFFEEAVLAGKQFITERRNLAVIEENNHKVNLYNESEKLNLDYNVDLDDVEIADSLSIPRRPKWDSSTTPEALAELEKLTFLKWRKKLAKLQEKDNLLLTPFEKNLEVWRQLWRVIEKSDILVQILDCRNPLIYLSDDLIKYVDEEFRGKKTNLVLLNKADFLTKEQRRMWSDYFKDRGIKCIFFSALMENENLVKTNRESKLMEEYKTPQLHKDFGGLNAESDDNDSEVENEEVIDRLENGLKLNGKEESEDIDQELRIYDKYQLLDTWRDMLLELESKRREQAAEDPETLDANDHQHIQFETTDEHPLATHRPLTIGLVGYPNVGKSSTINALLSAKRVAVSATPGKTKHFQTFLIDKDMMLCDCPGLVFPNFVGSKSEMITNGVLPIDQMKDYVGPVRLIVEKIPKAFFEEIYGLAFEQDAKQNLTADDLLNAFGFMRGYMTARGLPDISRAARKVCKDYINGKILYCEAPPGVDAKVYNKYSKLADAMKIIEERAKNQSSALRITERQRRLMSQARGTGINGREFDAQYFQNRSSGVHIKGLPGIGNMTQPIGHNSEIKVHKRDKKHKKKEKLRIVYRDLDI